MNLFEVVKASISTREAAQAYDLVWQKRRDK